jgi:beta-lactamase superfamily II metal-dependent hydrolase
MINQQTAAICYFLNVGQGSSSIVYLGDGRAVVIDGGRSSQVPLGFLSRYVNTIEALIVSHNDKDHQAGAAEILHNFRGRVKDLYFLEDRPVDRVGLFELAEGMIAERAIRVRRLERSNEPHVLLQDSASGLTLEILYPEYMDNYRARRAKSTNATSGIIALFCGSGRCLFPGDATIVAWQRLHARFNGRPIPCDVLAVPHHGGVIWSSRSRSRPRSGTSATFDSSTAVGELRWLYSRAIHTDYAVISVGTNNSYGHPRAEVIDALRDGYPKTLEKSIVLCTQITKNCCDDDVLEQIRPGLLDPVFPSLPRARSGARTQHESGGIACAGTVVAEIGENFLTVQRVRDHQSKLDGLQRLAGARPMCRVEATKPGIAAGTPGDPSVVPWPH